MKKFLAFIAVIIVLYSVYIDINFGTIPSISHASEVKEKVKKQKVSVPYKTQKIKPGNTVLSIVESINKSPLKVSIDRVITDFKKLNNDIKPEEIQIGQIYKFPIYVN
ncbi:hypothetical protein ACQKP0_17025 [Heyndrickxia sp. NPDC080065]|uniref:hypothetical protein n=1 Tax=Heyndrickxia sp. NPDC080065 TaxID=3390568 RepID=UPI003D0123ED